MKKYLLFLLFLVLSASTLEVLTTTSAYAQAQECESDTAGVCLDPLRFGIDACLSCDIIEDMIGVIYDLGETIFNAIRVSVLSILGIMTALWLLWNAAKLLFPFGPLSFISGLQNAIITRVGTVVLIALLMGSFQNYWQYVFVPPVSGAFNWTAEMMQLAVQTANASVPSAINLAQFLPTCDIASFAGSEDAAALQTSASCVIRNMQASIMYGLQSGLNTMVMSLEQDNLLSSFAVTMVILAGGLVLVILYGITFITFPLKIADVIIRWTLISILSPILFAALAFPATRSLTIVGFRGVVQGGLEIVMMGVVIALTGFVIIAAADTATADEQNIVLMSGELFWQLFLIGLIMNMMIGKVKGFAAELAGANFQEDVSAKMAEKMEQQVDSLTK